MYNFGKKIVWFFWILFLIFGSFGFWQTECDTDWEIKNSVWICVCKPWTKKIDGKCVSCDTPWVCCGIELNTNIPFIGNCIEFGKKWGTSETANNETTVTQEKAFPLLMWWLVKILVTIIILAGFIGILAGGVMISAAWSDDQKAAKWRKLIINVAIAIALLWASWVILRLINPNFFW